jgi:hypothetical protein
LKLDESAATAWALRTTLDEIVQIHQGDSEAILPDEKVQALNSAIQRFEVAVNIELSRAPIFHVSSKGVLDTRKLIFDAAGVYEGYRTRLPEEAIQDTNQAGRCLAFALPTAAGFHIARATEAVMLAELTALKCPQPKQRNWGSYIKLLEEHGANAKVVQHLRQIKDLHRNPLIHPEVTLTALEAQSLWALCTSCIQAMVADMEKLSAQPDSSISAMLPGPASAEDSLEASSE